MRAFIGVEFDEEVKQNIMEMQRVIRNGSMQGRWKYISNFHLTLKFLGEVSEKDVFSIFEKMKEKLRDFQSFDLRCGNVGFFKGKDSLRVVYLGFESGIAGLENLYSIIEECCSECGIFRDARKYTPHITIAQDVVLNDDFKELKDKLKGIHRPTIKVERVSIIKSEQLDGKRIYTDFLSIPLKNALKN